MKVLYIISTLRRCGPTNLLYDVICHLRADEFDVTVLTLSPEHAVSSRWKDFEAINGVKVISLNNNTNNIFSIGSQLKEICGRLNPDAIHLQGFRPDILAAMFLKKYKCVYNIQNYPYDDYVMQFGIKGYLMAFLNLFLIRNSKYVTACSEFIGSKIERNFRYPIHIVQNAVEEGFTSLPLSEIDALRVELGFKPDDRILVFAGNLIKRKNPLLLIEAFNLLYSINKNIKLLVLGNGYLMQECLQKKQFDNIVLRGNVEDVSKYYQLSHYYVTASLSEGMPVSVLEALNHGLPVVLSDIPQHIEITKSTGCASIVFNKTNASDLAEKIAQFTSQSYQDQTFDAFNSIKQLFNAKRMSNQFQNLYRSSL